MRLAVVGRGFEELIVGPVLGGGNDGGLRGSVALPGDAVELINPHLVSRLPKS
jgi:hypothetical protein